MGLAVKLSFNLYSGRGAASPELSFFILSDAKHVNLNVREEKSNPVLKYGKAQLIWEGEDRVERCSV